MVQQTILCDEEIIKTHLPDIIKRLKNKDCEIRADTDISNLRKQ